MVKIRLRRMGAKKAPFYRVVVEPQAQKEINRILDVITRTFIIKTSIYLLHFGGTING